MFRKMLAVMLVAGIAGVGTMLAPPPSVAAQASPSVTRSFSPQEVEPGGQVVVTINAANYGVGSAVTETLPAGFTYVSSTLPDDQTGVTGQEVRFTLVGDTSFTYTVTASSVGGSYTFSGTLRDSDRNDHAVGGDTTVTVSSGEPLVARYDNNNNGTIERSEVIAAISDYLFGEGDDAITRADVIKLIHLYLFAPAAAQPPGAPTGLTATANGPTQIDLSWSGPSDDGGAAITGYRIEVSADRSAWSDLVGDSGSTSTTHSHTGLTAGATRHYRVSAINSAGAGRASAIATGTTASAPPAGSPATDRAALVALYNATDGPNWTNNTGWLTDRPLYDWYGVTPDANGGVTELNLSDNQLTGEIPAELGNLSNLERLYLGANQLTGCVPAGLRDVPFNDLAGLGLDFCGEVETPETPPATDSCFQSLGALTGAVTRNGTWTGDCASTHQSGRYARFYSFTLNQQTEVEINLTSAQDTYLYLLRGADANGTVVTDNDDIESGNTNSRITRTLSAGTYTIEATTYSEGVTGDFTLSIVPTGVTAPLPADACEYVLTDGAATAPPGGAISGQWTGDCASTNQAGSYARYYIFTLASFSDMTITLESSVDTFLYLREGAGTGGTVIAKNDDVATGNTNSQIREFLSAGTYTIEAATHKEAITGEFTLTVTGISIVSVPASGDRDALVEFYHATGGSNWRNTDNWLSNSPLGQWYGVTTDSSDRVIELELSFNGLIGQLPAQLGNLSSLTHLDLSDNQLSGEIPFELGNLSNLDWLLLAGNQLTGCIPEGLRNVERNDFDALGLSFCGDGSPDLIVQSPSASNNNPDTGEVFTFYAQVHNQGDGASASTTLRYYRSDNDTISTSDTEVGSNDIFALGPSETWPPPSIGVNAPSLAGTYYYGACVDPVPGESNTQNNCSAAAPVIVGDLGSPDLVVRPFSVSDPNPDAGGPLVLYATVRNEGDGRLEAAKLTYYLSDNDTISGRDAAIRTVDVLDIDASSSTQMVLYGVNAPQNSGTYYYGACVHSSVPGESNTRNNCSAAAPVIVGDSGNPDLVVQSASVSDSSLDSGQSFTFYATVLNQGDGQAASTTLRYYRSPNPSISSQLDIEVGSDPVGSLPASRTSPESVGLDASLDGGTYYYGACVDPVPGESDPHNNCSSGVRVTVREVSPDLVVIRPSVSDSSLDAGQSFLLYATVRNRGDDRSPLTTLRYFLSVNSSISAGGIDTEIGSDRVPSLAASGTSDQVLIVTAPSRGGTYYYGACVDSVPGESDPHNNCSSGVRVTVTEVSPDLVVIRPLLRDERGLAAPLTSDISVDPGAPFTLYATAHNQGDGPSNSPTLRYYRSTNDTISTGDTEVGTDSVGNLSANAISSESIDLTAPSTPGTYYYGACVDSVSGESNTRNNCSDAVEVTVPPVRITHQECTNTGNLFGRTYTLTGTAVASRSLSNVTVIGYIVRYRVDGEVNREKVGEYDFGSMSANQPENFEMSKFFLFNVFEHQGCDFEFEWD